MGEIDIIALRGKAIVFIEVKASTLGTFDEVPVSTQQKRNILRTAKYFLAGNPKFAYHEISFEIYCLSFRSGIRRIMNPWSELV